MTTPSGSFDPKPVLKGELVELSPMEASHLEPLFAVAGDPKIWEQHPKWDRYKREVFEKFFNECLGFGSALVIRDAQTRQLIGSSTYRVDAANNQIEIGWTYLARAYWGGRYNGEVKRLMLATPSAASPGWSSASAPTTCARAGPSRRSAPPFLARG